MMNQLLVNRLSLEGIINTLSGAKFKDENLNRVDELNKDNDLALMNEIIFGYDLDLKLIQEDDDKKLDVLKAMRLQLDYYRDDKSWDEKDKIINKLERLYSKSGVGEILYMVSMLQENMGVQDNIAYKEEALLKEEALVYRIRGDIFRNLIKKNNHRFNKETKEWYEDLAIYNYEKGLNANKDDYKLRHGFAQALIFRADGDNEELLDKAIYHLNVLLDRFGEDKNFLRERFICYQLSADAYRKKCEYSKDRSFEEWKENAEKLASYIEKMNNYEVSRKVKGKHYLDREKSYMELSVGYLRNRENGNAIKYLDKVIKSYHDNRKLYKSGRYDTIIRAFATKAKILHYEHKFEESRENLEMALNLGSIGNRCGNYAKNVLSKCSSFLGYTAEVEEGIIVGIDEKKAVIYCETCGNYHFANISSLLENYTIDELEKIKEDKTVLEFTVLRSFISPLNKESYKDACYIKVTEKKSNINIEDIEIPIKFKAEAEKEAKRSVYELSLVEADRIGILNFNPYNNKGNAYTKSMDIDYSFELEDIVNSGMMDLEELKSELAAYETSKSYIKFDIYESVNTNTGRVKYVAKNVRFLL